MSSRTCASVFDVDRFVNDVNTYLHRFDITARDCASACGVHRATLTRLFAGERSLSLRSAGLLAAFCDLSLDAYLVDPFALEAAS
jgi:transcriptional regulator with XRE-family HTH domain